MFKTTEMLYFYASFCVLDVFNEIDKNSKQKGQMQFQRTIFMTYEKKVHNIM